MGEQFSTHHHEKVEDTVFHQPEQQKKAETSPNNNLSELESAYHSANDDLSKLDIAKQMAEIQPKAAVAHMIQLLEQSEFPFIREEIIQALQSYSDHTFGYDSSKDQTANAQALQNIKQWFQNKFPKN